MTSSTATASASARQKASYRTNRPGCEALALLLSTRLCLLLSILEGPVSPRPPGPSPSVVMATALFQLAPPSCVSFPLVTLSAFQSRQVDAQGFSAAGSGARLAHAPKRADRLVASNG